MHLEDILSAIASRRILVIGDVMLDKYVWGDASRLSPEAPVPVVRVDRETAVAGGAANVAFNLAALGARADLFGWVGEDPDGRRLRELLAEGRVSLLPGAVSPTIPTIVTFGKSRPFAIIWVPTITRASPRLKRSSRIACASFPRVVSLSILISGTSGKYL